MKREIKFRALKDDISNCNFVYGELVYDARGVPRITHKDFSNEGLKFNSCIKGTEGEYIGLNDKNGKEIYEGDIINLGSGNLLVEFKDGGFGWKSVMFEDSFIGFAGHTNFNKIMPRCVVVGSIHETPELLQPKAGGAKTLSKPDVISAVCFCAEEIEIATRVKCRTHGQYEVVEKQTDL